MYIKSLVLDGFKSYGQRTEFSGFDPQLNAIRGLKDSGKCDLVDAIGFVLDSIHLSQDLIYKSGQADVHKAMVSIIFDNSNPGQCPGGFESIKEITVTREMILCNDTYTINGTTVPNKEAQDLFRSMHINVNNPHFLIARDTIIEVINMKPHEILSMIISAAEFKMFESKQICLRAILKKDSELNELKTTATKVMDSTLEQLRQEHAVFLEFCEVEQKIEESTIIFENFAQKANTTAEGQEAKIREIEESIASDEGQIKQLDADIEAIDRNIKNEAYLKLNALETQLHELGELEAQARSISQDVQISIIAEGTKKKQLQTKLADDDRTLKSTAIELSEAQDTLESLRKAVRIRNRALAASQKRCEVLCADLEANVGGKGCTLQDQLMKLKKDLAQAEITTKHALMGMNYYQSLLKEKLLDQGSTAADYPKNQAPPKTVQKDIAADKTRIGKLNISGERATELIQKRRTLPQEISRLSDRMRTFETKRPYTQIQYSDPEPNFNKDSVMGMVCSLFKVKNVSAFLAVEAAAEAKLYHVVIDTYETGEKLLRNGKLQQKTTFIPMDKVQVSAMDNSISKKAESLVGKENVQLAMDCISYNPGLKKVMELVFGDVLICKDLTVARQLAFHPEVQRKCVTLDGEVVDPARTLSGGAPPHGGSVLMLIQEIQRCEKQLAEKQQELEIVEAEIEQVGTERLHRITYNWRVKEIKDLKNQIVELKECYQASQASEKRYNAKIKVVETKMKGSKGKELEAADREMKTLKQKRDKSQEALQEHEQSCDMLKMQIVDLKRDLESTPAQITACDELMQTYKEDYKVRFQEHEDIKVEMKKLQAEVDQEKGAIAEKKQDINRIVQVKEQVQAQIAYLRLQLRSWRMTDADCKDLEIKISAYKDRKKTLTRKVNTKVWWKQALAKFRELQRKYNILQEDKKIILSLISNLNENTDYLRVAYEQISKDFGSILSTLLPGANAMLLPFMCQTIPQEVDSPVEDVWKESLSKMDENQKYLAGLSLTLAMLLFKPAPFYILDEVDDILGPVQIQNIVNILKSYFRNSQFLIVSLRDDMFSDVNVLFQIRSEDDVSIITRTVNKNE